MLTRFQLVGVCLAVGMVLAVAAIMRPPQGVHAREPLAPAVPSDCTPEERAEHRAAHDRAAKAYIQNLGRLEIAKAGRERAAGKMADARKVLQFTHRAAWANVLTSHRATYQQLRQEAARSPTGEVSCTICRERQYLPYCILCADLKGKCVGCRGSGRHSTDEVCPTCLGSGDCFLCFGLGQMPCPFCNDGMVGVRLHPPPSLMPIE